MLKPKSIISGPELIVSRPKWIVCEAKLNVSKAKAVIYGPHLINCVTNIIISAPLCSNVPPKIGASLTLSLPERAALFRSHFHRRPLRTSCNQLDRSLPSMACAKPSMGRKDPSPCFHRTFGTSTPLTRAIRLLAAHENETDLIYSALRDDQ